MASGNCSSCIGLAGRGSSTAGEVGLWKGLGESGLGIDKLCRNPCALMGLLGEMGDLLRSARGESPRRTASRLISKIDNGRPAALCGRVVAFASVASIFPIENGRGRGRISREVGASRGGAHCGRGGGITPHSIASVYEGSRFSSETGCVATAVIAKFDIVDFR